MNYADGSIYEGDWAKDWRVGKGKMTWNTEDGIAFYEGSWEKD